MANAEHLKVLRQGVKVWNRWREENPDIRPDLSEADFTWMELGAVGLIGANLRRAELSGADLTAVDLSRVDLRKADLRRAGLSVASIIGADLRKADLRKVDLRAASIIEADLRYTDLRMADLRMAELRGANLSEAIFSQAVVGMTVFADLDLSVAKGLETIRHVEPSIVGIDTIYRSGGKIPKAFLRGAGLTDNLISYVASLPQETVLYYSCFISYSSKDEDFAQRLHNDLQSKGVRCWFAPEDMKTGDKIRLRIDESIRIHDKLLLVLSQHSVTSQWVEHEVEHALDLESERGVLVLFPIRLDEAVMENKVGWTGNIHRTRHIGDFTHWKDHDSYQQAFNRLLDDLTVTTP